jgi:hypothetical protein
MTHPVFGSMAALEQSFGKLGHPLTDCGLLLAYKRSSTIFFSKIV